MGSPFWILGDVFHRRYFVTYDFHNKRVGMSVLIPKTWWQKHWLAVCAVTAFVIAMVLVLGYFCVKNRQRRVVNRSLQQPLQPAAGWGPNARAVGPAEYPMAQVSGTAR